MKLAAVGASYLNVDILGAGCEPKEVDVKKTSGGGTEIAVLGAGMGGLAVAGLLLRAGVDVTVFEQAARFERVGTGIQISPNAVRVLNALGLSEDIHQVAFAPQHWRNRDAGTGELLNELELGERAAQYYGAPYYVLHRGDLHAALREAVPADRMRMGHRVVDVVEHEAGVRISCADGTSHDAKVLIAADGLNSLVRETMFRAEAPRYTGRVAYRAVIPAVSLKGRTLDDNVKWWGKDRHIVIYYLNAKRSEVYFTTSVPDPDWQDESWAAEGDIATLRSLFDDFHPDVRCVLDACERVNKWAIADRRPLTRWYSDRIALLGDACHPMTPYMAQGAAQSFEDAAILSRLLIQADLQMTSVGAAYQRAREERVERVQQTSHGNSWMRSETDSDWLYAYDAMNAPLT